MIILYIIAALWLMVSIIGVIVTKDIEGSFFISFVSAPLLFVMFIAIQGILNSVVDKETLVVQKEELQSVATGQNVGGSFVLGFGSIDSRPEYRFFVKDNGGFRLDSVRADRTKITETDKEPSIVTYKQSAQSHWVLDWFNYSTYEIRVPKDSVIQSYELTP